MCLEFYRQAVVDYNSSNIEFHFLSSSGGNFVAATALSIQLSTRQHSEWPHKYVNTRMSAEKMERQLSFDEPIELQHQAAIISSSLCGGFGHQ